MKFIVATETDLTIRIYTGESDTNKLDQIGQFSSLTKPDPKGLVTVAVDLAGMLGWLETHGAIKPAAPKPKPIPSKKNWGNRNPAARRGAHGRASLEQDYVRMIAWAKTKPDGFTTAELVKQFKCSKASAGKYVTELTKRGQLTRELRPGHEGHLYRPAPPPDFPVTVMSANGTESLTPKETANDSW